VPDEPSGTHRLIVPADRAGERLDRYLSEAIPGISRARGQRLIEEGNVRLAGEIVRPSTRLKGGEPVTVVVPPPVPLDMMAEDLPIHVLYEDAHLLVVDKPAGMVVHPAPGHSRGTLVNALLGRSDTLSGIGGVSRPGIVHRLDRDTSGVLVVARTDAAHGTLLVLAFAVGTVPGLVLLGTGASAIFSRYRRQSDILSGAVMILMALKMGYKAIQILL